MTETIPLETTFRESTDDVLDSLPCAVISTLPDGTLIGVNELFVSWTGKSREALLAGLRFQDLLTVPGRIFYETHFAPMLRMQGFVKEIACQLKREGREPLHVLVSSNLKLGPQREPLVIRSAIFEATDRARYEAELRRAGSAAQQLAAIVTSSGDAIVSVGLDAIVRTWNPGATHLFGYTEAEAVGRSVDELIVPEALQYIRRQKYEKLKAGETVFFKDTVRYRKDGSLVQVEIIASPMRDEEGQVHAASLIFRDISERKRNQILLQDSEDKLRLGIHVAGIGLGTVDYPSETIVLDETAAKLFALPAGQTLPRSEVHARFHPDDANGVLVQIEETLDPAGDGTLACEHRILWPDGSVVWVNARKQVQFLTEPDGLKRPAAGLLALLDITERKRAEAALNTSEIRYRRLFEAAHDGVLLLDPQTQKIVDANPFMTDLLGYSREQLVGRELNEIGFLSQAQLSRDMFQTLKDARQVRYESLPMQNRDGSIREVEVVANLYDEEGRSIIQCNVRDITERREIEAALREKEHFLQQVTAITPSVLQVFDIVGRRLVFINPSVETLLGFTPQEMTAMGQEVVPNLMHPEDVPRFEQHLILIRSLADGEVSDFEHRMRDREGRWHWFLSHDTVFARDATGAPTQLIGAASDITDRKQAETALREREERLRLILDGTLAFIGVMEPDGTLIEANAPALAAGGVMRHEVLNRKFWDTYWFNYDPAVARRMQEAVTRAGNGEIVREDVIVRMRGDTRMTIDFMLSPIRDEKGQVRLLVPSGFDITERKRTETALRQSHDTYLSLIEANPFGVYLIDADFRVARVSAGAQKVFSGIEPLIGRDFEEVLRILWPEPFASEAIGRFRHTLATGEPFHSSDTTERRANLDIVESYDWELVRVPLPDGRFGVVCYFYDMTERKRHEQQIRYLMGEVNHRSKNLLSVVQAIARQTARTVDPSTFAVLLSERIRGLAASQDLLVKNTWKSVSVAELVEAQLAHFGDMIGSRILIEGPPTALSPGAAQGIGMALHELSTNAVKYGALANATGRITVSWQTDGAQEPVFAMSWIEAGGPPVSPPTHKGFGNRVIGRMIEEAVGGKVEIEYNRSGLRWNLVVPASNLMDTRLPEA